VRSGFGIDPPDKRPTCLKELHVLENESNKIALKGRASGVKFCANFKPEMPVIPALSIAYCLVELHLLPSLVKVKIISGKAS